MVFSSAAFLFLFLPIVMMLYYPVPNRRHRNAVLLMASLFFYAYGEPMYIVIMILMVTVVYVLALRMSTQKKSASRKAYLIIGVIFSLSFLIWFKYTGFLLRNICGVFGKTSPFRAPELPIGISFYTFQVLTYYVDVYRGKTKPQKNLAHLLLYVSFFPQLIAGPIVNYSDIEASLRERTIRIMDVYNGMVRFVIGLAKKCIIANSCGSIVENLNGVSFSVGGAWLQAIAYALQLYFDFSGYSDMAIGLGHMFGFHFKENFRYPYTALSVTDFWRKWHISLGAFFREYVYIPLGGNRVSFLKHVRNIMVVWALTGIWHGASWNFLLWGLYYGILLILEKSFLLKMKEHLPKFINVLMTLFAVVIGWVLFYHTDLREAVTHVQRLFGIGASGMTDARAIYEFRNGIGMLLIGCAACFPFADMVPAMEKCGGISEKFITLFRPVATTVLLLISIAMIVGSSFNPFLYFRF